MSSSMDTFEQSAAAEIAEQVPKAVMALQQHTQRCADKMLFPDSDLDLSVIATLKRSALHQTAHRILVQLPHSERTVASTSVCLIVPDLMRTKHTWTNPDVDEESRAWIDILTKKHPKLNIKQLNKVITVTQLKREYSQVADKKKLSNSYDVFLVDAKIFKIVLRFIGCHFQTSTKRPIAVHVEQKFFIRELARAYGKVSLPIRSCRETISVRVGNLGQPANHLSSNVCAITDAMLKYLPGKAINLRSIYLKTEAVKTPLPIYVDFGSSNDVMLPVSEKNELEMLEGECSTLPEGLCVRVHPNGRVTVFNKKNRDRKPKIK